MLCFCGCKMAAAPWVHQLYSNEGSSAHTYCFDPSQLLYYEWQLKNTITKRINKEVSGTL